MPYSKNIHCNISSESSLHLQQNINQGDTIISKAPHSTFVQSSSLESSFLYLACTCLAMTSVGQRFLSCPGAHKAKDVVSWSVSVSSLRSVYLRSNVGPAISSYMCILRKIIEVLCAWISPSEKWDNAII